MAKHSKPSKVEVQKGPISMEGQYNYKFKGRPEVIMEDLENADMRRSKMTLTLHEPKK